MLRGMPMEKFAPVFGLVAVIFMVALFCSAMSELVPRLVLNQYLATLRSAFRKKRSLTG